ncbi:MAG TPA: hypothetical protein VNN55_05000 [bacterium]|nr:hypothetical protein [bacterium]
MSTPPTGRRGRLHEPVERCGRSAPTDAERDAEFREDIRQSARRGQLLAGGLAIVGPAFTMIVFHLLMGDEFELTGGEHVQMVHRDAFIVMGLGALTLATDRFRIVREHGRFIGRRRMGAFHCLQDCERESEEGRCDQRTGSRGAPSTFPCQ